MGLEPDGFAIKGGLDGVVHVVYTSLPKFKFLGAGQNCHMTQRLIITVMVVTVVLTAVIVVIVLTLKLRFGPVNSRYAPNAFLEF